MKSSLNVEQLNFLFNQRTNENDENSEKEKKKSKNEEIEEKPINEFQKIKKLIEKSVLCNNKQENIENNIEMNIFKNMQKQKILNSLIEQNKSKKNIFIFSTHGVNDSHNSSNIGLLCSGNNDQSSHHGSINHSEQVIFHQEIQKLELNNHITILSSCESCGSLSNAFLESGSKSVVCCRLEVDNEIAMLFNECFIGGLLNGKGKFESYRLAIESVRKFEKKILNVRKKIKNPLKWGGFQFIGED